MHRLLAAVLSSILVSTAFASTPIQITTARTTLQQRIAMRRALRLRHIQPTTPVIPGVRPPTRSSSSSSYSYTGTPVRGVLQIDQVSTGTEQSTAGTQLVTLMTFDAVAGNEDLNLSTLKFRAEQGTLGSASDYTLYAVSPTGVMTKIVVAPTIGTTLAFQNLRFILNKGIVQRFALQAKLNSFSSPSTLAIGFLTADPLFVQATGLTYNRDLAPGIMIDNGGCTGPYVCRIAVHTRTPRAVTVSSTGNLYVKADTTPASSRQLLLGSNTDVVFRLAFHATDEDLSVTSIGISGGNDSISGLALYADGSSGPFATATELQCDTMISGQYCAKLSGGLFSIPKDHEARVIVRAIVKAKTDGGVSGQTFTPVLTDIQARGLNSGHLLAANDGDGTADGEVFRGRDTAGADTTVSGSTHDTVAAKFAMIENASDDADLSPVPFGPSTFAKFRFTAASNANNASAQLTSLIFTVSANNVVLDTASLALYNTADPGRTAACSASGNTGTVTVTCSGLDSGSIAGSVSNGGSATFALRGTLSPGSVGGTSTLQAVLGQLGSRSNPGTVQWLDGLSSFNWIDVNATQIRSTQYRS